MKIANRQQLLMVLTGAVVALFAGDRAVYTPLSKLWDKRSDEIRGLQKQIADGKALIRQERVYRASWESMRTNALPNNQPTAVEQISKSFRDWAEESSVSLVGVNPQWKGEAADDYKTVVCRVEASGTLWMLSKFIYDIEKDPRGLKIELVDLNARDNNGQLLSLGLQVSGLVLNSQER